MFFLKLSRDGNPKYPLTIYLVCVEYLKWEVVALRDLAHDNFAQ